MATAEILSDYETPEWLHALENVTGASIHIAVRRWNFISGRTIPLRTLHWFCASGVPRMPWGKEKILTMWPGTVVLLLYCCMCPWAAAWDRSMEWQLKTVHCNTNPRCSKGSAESGKTNFKKYNSWRHGTSHTPLLLFSLKPCPSPNHSTSLSVPDYTIYFPVPPKRGVKCLSASVSGVRGGPGRPLNPLARAGSSRL